MVMVHCPYITDRDHIDSPSYASLQLWQMASYGSINSLLVFPDCDASCLTCSGPHASSCTSCREGLRLEGHGHCAPSPSKCLPHQYANQDGECHPCHKYCHRCSGPRKTECLSCNQRHLLLSESSSLFVRLVNSLRSACPGKLFRHLRLVCVARLIIRVCLLQMAPVRMNARQATTRTSRGRNVRLATPPVIPASGSTARSASPAKPTYFERAKNVWRPASTGSLTCSPSSCAAHPSH